MTQKTHTRLDEGISFPGPKFLVALEKAFNEKGEFDSIELERDVLTLRTIKGAVITAVVHGVSPVPKPPVTKIQWSPTPNGTVLHLYDPTRPARRSRTGKGLNPLCTYADSWRGTLHHANLLGEFKKKHGHDWCRRCKKCEKKAIKLGIKLEGCPA